MVSCTALDLDLTEAILPRLKAVEDLKVPHEMLTHPGHDAVRICATEIRSRVPAVPAATTPAPPVLEAVSGGELDKAVDAYVRTVLNRGADLSIGDMRAVSRLLQFGGNGGRGRAGAGTARGVRRRRRSEGAGRGGAAGRVAADERIHDCRVGEQGDAVR